MECKRFYEKYKGGVWLSCFEVCGFFAQWWAASKYPAIGAGIGTAQSGIPALYNWYQTEEAAEYAKTVDKQHKIILTSMSKGNKDTNKDE